MADIDDVVGTAGFAAAMVQVGWLRQTDEGVALPNWERWNGDRGRIRAATRERVKRHRDRGGGNASCNESVTESALHDENDEVCISLEEISSSSGKIQIHPIKEKTKEILEVFDYYRTYHPRAHLKPHSKMKEWMRIRARLNEGYAVADLKTAIDGCHKDPWHQGQNDRNQRYDSLELIVRDSSKVQKFIELSSKPTGPLLSDKTNRTMRAMESYLGKRSASGDTEP